MSKWRWTIFFVTYRLIDWLLDFACSLFVCECVCERFVHVRACREYVFTAHVSICVLAYACLTSSSPCSTERWTDGHSGGCGGRSLARRGKQREEGRTFLSRLLLSTVTWDPKLCRRRVRLTGDTKVSSRVDSGVMQSATWATKVTLCWRNDTENDTNVICRVLTGDTTSRNQNYINEEET